VGAAVVEEEDVAGGEAVEEAAGDRGRVALHGVEAAAGPGDVAQAGRVEHPVEEGVAQAGGGAEEARRLAGGGGDQLLHGEDLPPQEARGVAGEEGRVGLGVVLDAMAAAGDLGDQAGVGAGAAADHEEGGLHAGGVQQVEHARGDLGVRAVVEGEGDLPPAGGGVRETELVWPHQRAARPEAGGGERHVVGDQDARDRPPMAGGGREGEGRAGVKGERADLERRGPVRGA
jgi:hypothetical protein